MDGPDFETNLTQLRDMVTQEDWTGAERLIATLHPADQSAIFDGLVGEQQQLLIDQLSAAIMANILSHLDEIMAAELIVEMPVEQAASVVSEMEPDDAADLLGETPDDHSRKILEQVDDPDSIHPLLLHPDDSAGGLMTSEFLVLRLQMTVDDAIAAIRQWHPEASMIYYLFAVDAHDRLSGVISVRRLIAAAADEKIADIMGADVISVPFGTDQEETARIMSHYNLLALPVVDDDGKLMGIITIDDVVNVLEEEALEDMQRFGGSQPLERKYLDTSVLFVMRKRVGWLLLLFITGSLTSTVLRLFETDLQTVVELSFFVPMLIGTGGNAGSQATSTIIGALSVGDIKLSDALVTLWHELRIGLTLGFVLAVVAFGRTMLLGSSASLSLTVSLAIFVIVVWANGLGSLLPLLVTRLRLDPAAVSGPVMSTLVDATGLFIYFMIARMILQLS